MKFNDTNGKTTYVITTIMKLPQTARNAKTNGLNKNYRKHQISRQMLKFFTLRWEKCKDNSYQYFKLPFYYRT